MHKTICPQGNLFVPVSPEERRRLEDTACKPSPLSKFAMRRFRKNKAAVISAFFLILIMLMAFAGPHFSPWRFDEQIYGSEYLPPFKSLLHPLGTDSLGRDMFVRLMYGARISLAIGIFASFIAAMAGVLYGAAAGYFGGWVDSVLMRIVDMSYAVPGMLVAIFLSVVLRPSLEAFFSALNLSSLSDLGAGTCSIFITFALLYWVDMARLVRGQVLSLKHNSYVEAAEGFGAKPWWIIKKHIIPNCAGIIITTSMYNVSSAIFCEAFLSFIGLGVSAPMASLGSLANSALDGIYSYPYLLILPSVLICLIIMAFNLVGDGLRDAFDPEI